MKRADLPAYLVGRAALVGRRDNGDRNRFSNRTDHGSNDTGTSRLHLVRACEASLRRLKTHSSISIRCTDRTGETPTQETLWALDESGPRRQGSLSRRRQFLRTGDLQNFGAGSLQPDVSRHRKTDGAFLILRQIRHGHEFVFSACGRIADRQVPAASLLRHGKKPIGGSNPPSPPDLAGVRKTQ